MEAVPDDGARGTAEMSGASTTVLVATENDAEGANANIASDVELASNSRCELSLLQQNGTE